MKLRLCLISACMAIAALSGAVNRYIVYSLPDLGFGSQARHIASWTPASAQAVGDVNLGTGVRRAAIWTQLTKDGPGTLTLMPVSNSGGNSTVASCARLADGRTFYVGQITDAGGVRRAATWVPTIADPTVYVLSILPDSSDSTGSEALDASPLPGGGAVVIGTRWPGGVWKGCVWSIGANGRVRSAFLPKPPGQGWSSAQSITPVDAGGPNTCIIAGHVQPVAGGIWRACTWALDLNDLFAVLNFAPGTTIDSYGYRINPAGTVVAGWLEDEDHTEYGSTWGSNGLQALGRMSRLYGINSTGYVVGFEEDQNGVRQGLVSHTSYFPQHGFELRSLMEDEGHWGPYLHIYCNSEHNFLAGFGTTTDYQGGPATPHAFTCIPDSVHLADLMDLSKGVLISGDVKSLLRTDGQTVNMRSFRGQIGLDLSIQSPRDAQTGHLSLTVAGLGGNDALQGSVQAYDWVAGKYRETDFAFGVTAANPTVTHSWATFPSSWQSATEGVRFRVVLMAPSRFVVKVDSFSFGANQI